MMRDIGQWLEGLGLGKYAEAFVANDIDLDVLRDLNASDLERLGLSLGHRKRLLRAIGELDAVTAPKSEPVRDTGAVDNPLPAAERRQLTVLFVDLVGSTALSGRIDPEDMREVIAAYQNCCSEVIERLDGYVAKFMGDGVLAYFGWPMAHEDDAERAVRAGLDLILAVAALKPRNDLELAARVGISTGQVIVGDLIGKGAAQEQAVVGETPNLAARIQGLAPRGAVVIGPVTKSLVGAAFEFEDLGEQALAGVSGPTRLWRVVRTSPNTSRFDMMRGAVLAPLVGRDEEVAILARRWELARRGEGQVVVISGEAGIGKSRLVQVLLERIADEGHTRLGYQCSPLHVYRAFHPIIAQLERAAGFAAEDQSHQKLDKLQRLIERQGSAPPADLEVFAALLALHGGERLHEIEPDPERRKGRIVSALFGQLTRLTAAQPVLCIFEDAHWSDPSTIDFFKHLVDWSASRPILVLVTCRPEFASPWTGLAHSALMALRRMPAGETADLINRLAGQRRLPDEVVRKIAAKTDGIPLFIEEMTRTVIESSSGERSGTAGTAMSPASALAVPTSLHDSLMARLDRVPGIREVAQLGAAIGRTFDFKLLSAVANRDADALTGALSQLELAGLLIRHGSPPNSSYSFKHALIQEAAYGSLLRAIRQDYHSRIASALERRSADLSESDPVLLAYHYAEADALEPAIRNLRQAGENAVENSAYTEAIENFAKGLALLARLPDSIERTRQEIAIRLALGGAQVQSLGPTSPEVQQSYLRALELCRSSGSQHDLFTALWGLWFFHYMRGDIHRMREFGDGLLPLAEKLGDPALLLEAHHVQWAGLSLVGDFQTALAHTQEGLNRYDRNQHHWLTYVYGGHDPGLCARNLNAVLLCIQGYPEQARQKVRVSVAMARELGHPYTVLEGHFNALLVEMLVREFDEVERHTLAIDELVRSGKLPEPTSGVVDGFRGWLLAERGSIEEGLDLMRRARATWQSFFGAWCFPLDGCAAALMGKAGNADEGIALLDLTLENSDTGGAHWWNAELHRIRANLRTMDGAHQADAQADLEKSIAEARAQNARFFELRAAKDLAALWAARGERQRAFDLLAPIHDWFTEGHEIPELVAAKRLLDELR